MNFYRWITSTSPLARWMRSLPGLAQLSSRTVWEMYGVFSPDSAVAHDATGGGEVWEERARRDVAHVLAILPVIENALVVDIACGMGRVSNAVASAGPTVIATDISQSLMYRGKKMYTNPRIHWHHIQKSGSLPFCADASADAVMCWYAFQHMEREDVLRYLSEARRILKKGGYCIAEFPLLHHTPHQEMYKAYVARGGPWSSARMRWYTHDELSIIFQLTGFNIVKMEGESECVIIAQKLD